MRIAYVSYEHPLGYAGGGIGTYLGQVAKLMADRGHEVEVFTGHSERDNQVEHDGYLVHRVKAVSISAFRELVVSVFSKRHTALPFDVLEAAEYGAEALRIKQMYPQLPLVVKLHTPAYLTHRLNSNPVSFIGKARFMLSGLVRGRLQKPYWIYRKEEDPEYEQFCLADAICSPSKSLGVLIREEWPTEKEIAVIPNPFVPSPQLLNIALKEKDNEKLVVGFFGRLEPRKGILELMKAIPLVLQKNKNIHFHFIGKPHPSPLKGMDMEVYLKKELQRHEDHLQFFGQQPYEKIAGLLAATDVCVFPSVWENFPNVCLEAMAAGKAVIASNTGGMAEMIRHAETGFLVPARDPAAIADAILQLAAQKTMITALGRKARQSVLDNYDASTVGDLVASFYTTVLNKSSIALA